MQKYQITISYTIQAIEEATVNILTSALFRLILKISSKYYRKSEVNDKINLLLIYIFLFWQTTIDYSCGYLIILIDLFQYQEITQGHFQKLHLQNKTKTFIVGGNHTIYISSFTVLKIEAFYKRCYFKKVKHHHCLCL